MPKYILNTGRTPIGLTIPPKLRTGKETRVHFPPSIGAVDTGLTGDEKYELVDAKFFIEVDREMVACWLKSSGAYFDEGMLKVFDERPAKTSLPEAVKATVDADELTEALADIDAKKTELADKAEELETKSDDVAAKAQELENRSSVLDLREMRAKVGELKNSSDEAVLEKEKAELALEKIKAAKVPKAKAEKDEREKAVADAQAAVNAAAAAAKKAVKAHEEAAKALEETE